jgi:hypothetical protein
LQLTILDLGIADQQAKVDRLKLEVDEKTALAKRAERIQQRLELVWKDGAVDADGEATQAMFGQVYAGIKTRATFDVVYQLYERVHRQLQG